MRARRGQREVARRRAGFTLVEVMVALMIATFVLGAIWVSLSQMTRSRSLTRARLAAHLRADAALASLRQDVASVIRSEDLYWTRLRITDSLVETQAGPRDRDTLLVFSTRLRSVRHDPYQGEGIQFETQYRIEDDGEGPVLWRRRDPMPDEYPDAGGVAAPVAEGVAGINFEAYDGYAWHEEWDSDLWGLPLGVRITVVAPVHAGAYDDPVVLRTIVPIDRVIPPFDAAALQEQEEAAAENEASEAEGPTGEGEADGGAGSGANSGAGGAGGADAPPDRARPSGGARPSTGRPTGGGGRGGRDGET